MPNRVSRGGGSGQPWRERRRLIQSHHHNRSALPGPGRPPPTEFPRRHLTAYLLLALACHSADAQPRNRLPLPDGSPPVPLDARPARSVPEVTVVSAVTIDEFVRTFKSVPGRATYEVVFVHPCTCKPVKVCIELPGCPKCVRCGKTEIVFRYGLCKKPVTVTFCRDGAVLVR